MTIQTTYTQARASLAHLLRSPANVERLLNALGRALRRESTSITLEQIWAEVGGETKEA